MKGDIMAAKDKNKILLIDDDASLLLTLRDFLSFEGYEVITADSGEQGLEKLKDYDPDLIIVDMSMPGMGGIGFLKAISGPNGEMQHSILVLTARANMAEFFADVDVDGFVAKPCNPEDLLMEVARIIFLKKGPSSSKKEISAEPNRHVLLGEDDESVLKTLTEAFTKDGFDVDSVTKGPEILEKAIVCKPAVIVLKRIFTGMNGDVVAGLLKQMPNTKEIPVVLYDNGDLITPETKYIYSGSGVKKYIRTHYGSDLLAAVKSVL
jgi:DNA-binding response OmpR family regulator